MMRQLSTPLAIILFTIFLTSFACKNEEIHLVEDEKFCEYVDEQNFDGLKTHINNYLKKQKTNDEEALDKFKSWLNSKSCVENAEIICDSCMESLPPKTIMGVVFKSNDQLIEMNMHVRMGKNLEVVSIHEP